ncbi:MAG TPA: VOC family protein [Gemmataceae bacterium]|jgi:catechol 2,3-dioxygenase-like lactoylglutathione lyase family enzyme|nr:VOC family protein [Gemmataceae bacterium]
MDMKLEVVVVPVSDVERAKRFYQRLGWRLDIDVAPNENYRAMQFTPPGSEASIIFGKGVTAAQPGSIDRLLLAVDDIDATRTELLSRDVEVSEVFHDAAGSLGGGFQVGTVGRAPGPDPERRSYGTYASFRDPDGNVWLLQEIKERLPGRVAPRPADGELTVLLEKALRSAADAHGVHEKELGRPDPDWPRWYAGHMARTIQAARGPGK